MPLISLEWQLRYFYCWLINYAFSVLRLYSIRWYDRWMINWKGFEKKWSQPDPVRFSALWTSG
jgi:hypothetical protein